MRRPLRRDAERNRQRILKAAAEVFDERGLEVSLDEVARHAGVGVGTVYRRFPTKEELMEALFMERIDSIAALAEAAGDAADPWSGLVSFIEQVAEMLAGDLGLRQMLMFATYGRDTVLVRAVAERAADRPAGRASPGGRAAAARPAADRHPVHYLRTHRGDPAGPGGQPRDLAPLPQPRPGRHAAAAGGHHTAARAGPDAGGAGEDHAPERAAAALTFLMRNCVRACGCLLHLHVHAQCVNDNPYLQSLAARCVIMSRIQGPQLRGSAKSQR